MYLLGSRRCPGRGCRCPCCCMRWGMACPRVGLPSMGWVFAPQTGRTTPLLLGGTFAAHLVAERDQTKLEVSRAAATRRLQHGLPLQPPACAHTHLLLMNGLVPVTLRAAAGQSCPLRAGSSHADGLHAEPAPLEAPRWTAHHVVSQAAHQTGQHVTQRRRAGFLRKIKKDRHQPVAGAGNSGLLGSPAPGVGCFDGCAQIQRVRWAARAAPRAAQAAPPSLRPQSSCLLPASTAHVFGHLPACLRALLQLCQGSGAQGFCKSSASAALWSLTHTPKPTRASHLICSDYALLGLLCTQMASRAREGQRVVRVSRARESCAWCFAFAA